MPIVEVKGVGEVEFPDSMTPQEIQAVLREKFGNQPAGKAPASMVNDPRAALLTIGSSAVAEPLAGLAGIAGMIGGLVPGGESPSEKGARFVAGTRDAVTIDPVNDASRAAVEAVGKVGEVATKGVRAPVAGIAGAYQAVTNGADAGAETTRRVMNEGIGPTAASALADSGAPPAVSALAEAIPTGISSAFGLKGVNRVSPKVVKASDELTVALQRRGINPADSSPQNLARINETVESLTGAQAKRVQALREVGVDNPTRAQVTRSADDFQAQQELAKTQTPVRNRLESQDAAITQRFDEVIQDTAGKPVTSGSTVVDEVVGRSTKLDQEISNLYKVARERAAGEGSVDLSKFANRVIDNLDSDGATGGLYSAMRGELRRRGVIDKDGNVVAKVDVDAAEEIRKFANAQFDAKNSAFANSEIRRLKNALDEDVFAAAGKDVFAEARRAKAEFETDLSNAKISKFDKNNRSLVRDILENKIDPNSLVERITASKSYRARDLKQLRDYLSQTDDGVAAFDDLRAQVMQNIKEKSLIGPEDAQGVQTISRAKLERELGRIGRDRMNVLFTVPERRFLDNLLEASKIREPVRGTALGKGPSAQAIEGLNKSLADLPFVGKLLDSIRLSREGKVILQGSVQPPAVSLSTPPQGLIVPLAASQAVGSD